ncbi:DegV family protein [Alicyclobacillaceae bacterium I2511]|nr:DegV family protein [Alicyclobacillaceae bacterium I2511]
MPKIAFVTDSAADLTLKEIRDFNITVLPQQVIFADKSYRDGIDLTPDKFFTLLKESPQLPTTSQPSVGDLHAAFSRLMKDYDTVLALFVSQKLSGTYRTALSAAQMVGGDIHVVDSKFASFGLGGPLLDGVRLAKLGVSAMEIVHFWERVRESVRSWFVVDTLEYMHKGGRIGGAASIFGALLQIKPILTIKDGAVDLLEKVRTHHRAMERILSEFATVAAAGQPLRLAVIHSQRELEATELAAQLATQYPHVRVSVVALSAVISTHAGPGLLALLCYPLHPRLTSVVD